MGPPGGLRDRPVGVAWSLGKRSCVGETLGPIPALWLDVEVVTDSEDVAVVGACDWASAFTVLGVSWAAVELGVWDRGDAGHPVA